MLKTIYHINDGPVEMYEIDANSAVGNFPKEWSFSPWPEKKASKAASAQTPAAATYASKDNGDGTFSIIDNTGAVIGKPITAEEAKAFDAMSDTDKATYAKGLTPAS